MNENIANYLTSKGLDFHDTRETGDETIFKVCFSCGDDNYHFYANRDKNTYFCQKCNAKGNLITLKQHFQDTVNPTLKSFRQITGSKKKKELPADDAATYHQKLLNSIPAYNYLLKRGLSAETIKHFKLGLMTDNQGDWIAIPYYKAGKLINFKFRSLPPAEKDFKRVPGAASALFNQDCLPEDKNVVITEGEFDAMMCWQSGLTCVVTGSNGCSNFEPEWIDQLADKEKIYLWYDNDDKGRPAADDLAGRLGIERCYFIREEGYKDANEYFVCHDIYDLCRAEQKPISNVIHFWESVFKIFEHERTISTQIVTPWASVDRLVGAIEKGDLLVLSAVPKTGKSTFALNIATYNAKNGQPIFYYCLEMRPERLAKKVIESEGRISKDNFNRDKAIDIANRISDMPLYFGYNYKNITPDSVFNTIRSATKRYGIKLVIFDNLHYLVRSIVNVSAEVGNVTRGFKLLAEELQIPVLLIAQPRKIEDGAIMTMNDLKDSSSIGADSDQVIIMYRKKTKSKMDSLHCQEACYEPKTLIRVDASRYNSGGDTALCFHGEYSRFDEYEKIRTVP